MKKNLKLILITLSIMAIFAAITYASPPAAKVDNNVVENAGNLPSVALVITEGLKAANTEETSPIVSNENQTMVAATLPSNGANSRMNMTNTNEAAITAEQTAASLIVNTTNAIT